MAYKQKTMFSLPFLLAIHFIHAQELNIGERLPGKSFKNVMNYAKPFLKTSDFKGKTILFEFWGINCMSCIENFPKIEALQEKFNDRLQIILVNQETKQKTFERLNKLKPTGLKMPKLPMITGDSFLHKLFPLNGAPLYVWINSNGIFKHRTAEIGPEHLEDFFAGRMVKLPEDVFYGDWYAPLSIFEQKENKWLQRIKFYSYLSQFLPNAHSHDCNSCSTGIEGVYRIHCRGSAVDLIRYAYSNGNEGSCEFLFDSKYEFAGKDTFKYLRPANLSVLETDEWIRKFYYEYDLAVPDERKEDVFKIMRNELENYFPLLEVSIEKRLLKSYVLIRNSNKDLAREHGLKNSNEYLNRTAFDSVVYYVDTPFNEFIKTMHYIFYQNNVAFTLIDSTGYSGNIDLVMKQENLGGDISGWKKELNKYGFDLEEKNVMQDFLVIQEKDF